MNKYDLDFQNIFEDLGIESFDLEYLKGLLINEIEKLKKISEGKLQTIIRDIEAQIRETNDKILMYTRRLNDKTINVIAKNQIINEIENLNENVYKLQENIQKQTRHASLQLEKIDETIAQVKKITSVEKALRMLSLALIASKLAPSKQDRLSREEIEKLRAIKSIISKTKSLDDYIKTRQLIFNTVDIDERNQKYNQYKLRLISGYSSETCKVSDNDILTRDLINKHNSKSHFVEDSNFRTQKHSRKNGGINLEENSVNKLDSILNRDNIRRLSRKNVKDKNIISLSEMNRLPDYKFFVQIGQKDRDGKWILEPRRLYEEELKRNRYASV